MEHVRSGRHEVHEDAVRRNPDLARYLDGWGRDGDLGVIAELERPGGAAWVRMWNSTSHGYAYVDDITPELVVGVEPEPRGRGVGTLLLTALLDRLALRYGRVALTVRLDNPALRLYERLGFRVLEGSAVKNRVGGTSVIMICDLR